MFDNSACRVIFTVCLMFAVCSFPLQGKMSADSAPVKTGKPLQGDRDPVALRQLMEKRDLSAFKGLQWMDDFLDGDDQFKTMPFETFQFFHVCAQTSSSPQFQRRAQNAADKYAMRLKRHCLAMRDPMNRYDFLQLLEFISKRDDSGIDYAPLIEKAKRNYSLYKSTVDIYGTPVRNLAGADWKTVYETLLYAYFLEKADVEYPGVFKVDYRLLDVLGYLRTREYVNFADDGSADKKRAIEDAFMVTHIAYMLSNYSRLRLYEQEAPWLYDYLRKNFDDILAIGHMDLIGECVDIFRSLGYTEDNSEIVRTGTQYLLSRQNAEGAWGENHQLSGSAYDSMHPTSCAIWALRARTFPADTKYDRRIRRILQDLNWGVKKDSKASSKR